MKEKLIENRTAFDCVIIGYRKVSYRFFLRTSPDYCVTAM